MAGEICFRDETFCKHLQANKNASALGTINPAAGAWGRGV